MRCCLALACDKVHCEEVPTDKLENPDPDVIALWSACGDVPEGEEWSPCLHSEVTHAPLVAQHRHLLAVDRPGNLRRKRLLRRPWVLPSHVHVRHCGLLHIPVLLGRRERHRSLRLKPVEVAVKRRRDGQLAPIERKRVLRFAPPREEVKAPVHRCRVASRRLRRTNQLVVEPVAPAFMRGLCDDYVSRLDGVEGTGSDFLCPLREPLGDGSKLGDVEQVWRRSAKRDAGPHPRAVGPPEFSLRVCDERIPLLHPPAKAASLLVVRIIQVLVGVAGDG